MRIDKLTGLGLVAVIAAVLLAGGAGATELTTPASGTISVGGAGLTANNVSDTGRTAARQVSATGRYVVFLSTANNLVPGDTNHKRDVFVRDTQTGVTTRVNVDSSGAQADNVSSEPTISANGRYVAFSSDATNLVTDDVNGASDIFIRDTQAGTTTRVSVASSGTEADGPSTQPSISADGRYVAFTSDATNFVMVGVDMNGVSDVFVRDTQSGTTTLVSFDSGEVAAADSNSLFPVISGDGNHVAFASLAFNLVSGDTNSKFDIFTRDLVAGTTTRISLSSAGAEGTEDSTTPAISDDGRYVAFASQAPNLVASDGNNSSDVFVRDTQLETTTRVSVDGSGSGGNSGSSAPSISAAGRYVAFTSDATNLVGADTNTASDVFVRDTVANATTRVSVTSDGTQANDISAGAALSGDGRYVLFGSAASNLAGTHETNTAYDVFVHDRQAGTTTPVSILDPALTASGYSATDIGRQVSSTGRYVVFSSGAADFVAGDTNGSSDAFVRDTQTNTTTRVSVDSNEVETNGGSVSKRPTISADGRYVAFDSNATNLVSGDTNVRNDVFVRDIQTGTTTRVSVNSGGAEANGSSYARSISADGRYIAFASDATDLVSGDTNGVRDVFVRDTQAGTTIRVSVNVSGNQVSAPSDLASISGDGSRIAFSSNATDLVSGDTNGVRDVFVRDTQAGTTIRASVNSAGAEGNLSSDDPAISDDGRSVAFDSSSTTFVSPGADTNNATDVFLRDIQAGTTTRISLSSSGGQSDAASYDPSLGEDGDYVAFVSDGAGLVPDDTNGLSDIFVRSVQTGVTTRVNLGSGGAQASGNGYADYPSLSASGRYVVFYSTAPNLAGPNDANGVSGDVFLRDLGAAPTLASASVNGQTLTLGYSEPLAGTAPAASAYTVHAGSGTIAVSSVAINGSAATLTLAAAVAGGQSVTLDYALPAASPVADLYGHAAGAISAYAVANQLAGPAGTPTAGATTPTGSTVSGAKATPGVAGSITTGSGPTAATISWPAAGIATQPVTVSVSSAPGVVAGTGGFAAGTTAIQVTVTTASGAAVTAFSAPLDLQFPNAPAGVVPAFTHDGLTWDAIPALTGTTLPPGYRDGWYRDSAGTLHILTLHATYFGLLEKGSTVAAAFTLSSGTRLEVNLNYRHALQLYLASSLPSNATITLSRAGKTLGIWHAATTSKSRALAITIPRAARKVGTYRLGITARASGSTLEVTRNATLHFTARWRKLT